MYQLSSNTKYNSFCYFFTLVENTGVGTAMDICTHYPDISVIYTSSDLLQYVVVTKKEPTIDPIAGPICNPRLIIISAIEVYLDFQIFSRAQIMKLIPQKLLSDICKH